MTRVGLNAEDQFSEHQVIAKHQTERFKKRAETNELKARNGKLEHSLASSRSVANALDAEVDNGRIRIKELEEFSSSLAEENEGLRNEVLKLRKKRLK